MLKHNKSLRALALGLLVAVPSVKAAVSLGDGARILGCLLATGGTITLGDYLRKNDDILAFADNLNMSRDDLEMAVTSALFLTSLSLFPFQSNFGTACRQFAFRLPFITALTGVVSSKWFKGVMKNVWGVGKYFGACENPECEGCCNNCKARTTLITVALWMHLGAKGADWFEGSWVGQSLGLS